MISSHPDDGAIMHVAEYLPAALAVVAAACYVGLAMRRRREPRGWNTARTVCFAAGALILAWALVPSLLPFGPGDFRQHMVQHLLIAMVAPLGLVLGAPVTLFLRSAPRRAGRQIGRVLHTPTARAFTHPVTALVLNIGGLAALYFTPLYNTAQAHPAVHHLVHVHFFLAGFLFAWAIAGVDPAPKRPSVPARLVLLGIAVAAHAILSQVMYAGVGVTVDAPVTELRGGAELMYYGGDIAELLLAIALLTTWKPSRRPAAAHRVARTGGARVAWSAPTRVSNGST